MENGKEKKLRHKGAQQVLFRLFATGQGLPERNRMRAGISDGVFSERIRPHQPRQTGKNALDKEKFCFSKLSFCFCIKWNYIMMMQNGTDRNREEKK